MDCATAQVFTYEIFKLDLFQNNLSQCSNIDFKASLSLVISVVAANQDSASLKLNKNIVGGYSF